MIAYVKGILSDILSDSVIVDVGGVGFQVFCPVDESILTAGTGSEIKLYTYMNVREDAIVLYGFSDKETLDLYRKLITVNGVGPKSGLAILSALSAQKVVSAIAGEDAKLLSSVPGIGAKTASRIILDLKDKVGLMFGQETGAEPASQIQQGPAQEAVEALTALGFTQSEARSAVRRCAKEGMSVEDIIRLCLKELY